MRLYWTLIAVGSIVGMALFIGVVALYYSLFSSTDAASIWGDAIRWGASLAAGTALFIILGTLPFARRLQHGTRRAFFVAGATLGAGSGWLILGVVSSEVTTWSFFAGYAVIAVVASVGAGIVSAILMFFAPTSRNRSRRPG